MTLTRVDSFDKNRDTSHAIIVAACFHSEKVFPMYSNWLQFMFVEWKLI